MAFMAPNRKPRIRFSHPSIPSFTILSIPLPRKWERIRVRTNIAANMIMCITFCSISIERSAVAFSESGAVNLNAHHNPSSRAAILTNCLTKPLNIPHIAEAAIITRIMISNKPKSICRYFFFKNRYLSYLCKFKFL